MARAKLVDASRLERAIAADAKRANGGLPPTAAEAKRAAGSSPAETTGPAAVPADSKEVRLGDMRLLAPASWTRQQPPIPFILAQFSLPQAKGDASDAQLTVSAGGESGPKGLKRLQEQLKEKPEKGSVEHFEIAGGEVIVEENSADGDVDGPFQTPTKGGRQRVLNAMVLTGGKVYFVNCTGPEKTVSERAGEFRAFLKTMKPVNQP